jgi:hypothetical protein
MKEQKENEKFCPSEKRDVKEQKENEKFCPSEKERREGTRLK